MLLPSTEFHPRQDCQLASRGVPHAAATMMLGAAAPPAEVACLLGHSVDVLMRVYAGVFDDERERSKQLTDKALRRQPGRRLDRPTR